MVPSPLAGAHYIITRWNLVDAEVVGRQRVEEEKNDVFFVGLFMVRGALIACRT